MPLPAPPIPFLPPFLLLVLLLFLRIEHPIFTSPEAAVHTSAEWAELKQKTLAGAVVSRTGGSGVNSPRGGGEATKDLIEGRKEGGMEGGMSAFTKRGVAIRRGGAWARISERQLIHFSLSPTHTFIHSTLPPSPLSTYTYTQTYLVLRGANDEDGGTLGLDTTIEGTEARAVLAQPDAR